MCNLLAPWFERELTAKVQRWRAQFFDTFVPLPYQLRLASFASREIINIDVHVTVVSYAACSVWFETLGVELPIHAAYKTCSLGH